MILGEVNHRLEPTLNVVIFDGGGVANTISAMVDTGFGGYLTLPNSAIRSFELRRLGRQRGILADGSQVDFAVYGAEIEWGGKRRRVEVHAADADSLVGMALLENHELKIEVRTQGCVAIVPLEGVQASPTVSS